MILATLSNLAALLISVGLAFVIGVALLRYRRICKLDAKRRARKVFYEETWTWPERNVGPVSRTHLGRRS
jgi:hypothetical protein